MKRDPSATFSNETPDASRYDAESEYPPDRERSPGGRQSMGGIGKKPLVEGVADTKSKARCDQAGYLGCAGI